ncbi:hypothetical protein [Salinivibrio kushneri]|uniref:hypothetical protein n=1 Tax=Salinivibrio kushneri TaxID=1908198 RepID=UPI0022B44284|nr:hypothetical protein [Salinivibrio kushneri]WBA12873.1 hypothetical protein O4546_06645 [Salinivibrio kushneri]
MSGSFIDSYLTQLRDRSAEDFIKINYLLRHLNLDETIKGRYSILFLCQIYERYSSGRLDIELFQNEILYLEGLISTSETKKPTQFKDPPLRGLWHKHYYSGTIKCIATNALNSFRKYGVPFLKNQINKEKLISITDINSIVEDITTNNPNRRRENSQATGDWIVFARVNGENYYLCLADHPENGREDDNRIMNGIEGCFHQFPFIKKELGL